VSYILDALRKAQQDQRKGQPPDVRVSIGGGEGPRSRRTLWPWLMGALVVNVLVLTWALWPRAPEPVAVTRSVTSAPPTKQRPKPEEGERTPLFGPQVSGPQSAAVSEPRPRPDVRSLAAEAKVPPAPSQRLQPQPAAGPPTPAQSEPPTVASGPTKVTPVPRPAPVAEATGTVTPPAPSSSVPAPRPAPGPAALRPTAVPSGSVRTPPSGALAGPERPPPVPSSTPPRPQPAPPPALQPAAAPAKTTPSSAQLPLLQDLPAAVRQGLPPIEINGHVYSEDPSRRFVFINWQSYREGDRIGGARGPLLEKITPEGLVVDFGSVRARVNVSQ